MSHRAKTHADAVRRPPDGHCGVYVRWLPTSLRDKFKAYCARRGLTMSSAIEDFMRDCIKKDGTKPPRKSPKRKRPKVRI